MRIAKGIAGNARGGETVRRGVALCLSIAACIDCFRVQSINTGAVSLCIYRTLCWIYFGEREVNECLGQQDRHQQPQLPQCSGDEGYEDVGCAEEQQGNGWTDVGVEAECQRGADKEQHGEDASTLDGPFTSIGPSTSDSDRPGINTRNAQ